MKNINDYICKCKRNKVGPFANNLYSPKKILLDNNCSYENTDFNIHCHFKKYYLYTKYRNCEYLVLKYNDYNNIYILNEDFDEIGKIELKVNSKYKTKIVGITYDSVTNKIYLSNINIIYSIDSNGNFIKEEINNKTLQKIVSETCFYDKCDGKIILPYNPCSKNTNIKSNKPCIMGIGVSNGNIIVSYEINGSVFLANLTINGNIVNEMYVDDNLIVTNIIDSCCSLYIIGKKDCDYEYLYLLEKDESNCKKKINYCEIILDSECKIDIECPDFPCNIDGSLCEIIYSIALIEKAIAKLICMESEKIKKILEDKKCNKEIIDVNNSVCKTIDKITCLENILKEKLEIALNEYCKDKKNS